MALNQFQSSEPGNVPKKKRYWKIALIVGVVLLIVAGAFIWKTGFILDKVSGGNANIFKSLVKSLPGVDQKVKGEEEGRINILLLGMRGEGVEGGGLLADTIMVLSIHPSNGEGDASKASLISIPRDLYVKVPGRDEQRKINAVYALGEEREYHKGGIEDMRTIVGEVTGLDIPYAVTINFKGFVDLVDAMGGVTVSLTEPFNESQQFHEPHVCDTLVFTDPMKNEKGQQMYECKFSQKPRSSILYAPKYDPYPLCQNKPRDLTRVYKVMAQYPLCYNKNSECGGNFSLPAGDSQLDGKTALCYARARYTSNDFERAKRQQQVIQEIKKKALSAGTLTDFSKVNAMLDSLGNNVSTNMEAWEMKRLFTLYQKIGDVNPNQKVLENSEEGLLYAPTETGNAGYILLPRGDNYDKIRELFQNSLK